MTRIMLLWVAIILLSAPALSAPPTAKISRSRDGIRLDGKGDDPAWRAAATLGAFSVYLPKPDLTPKFSASARVIVGRDSLYVLVTTDVPKQHVYAPLAPRDSAPAGDSVEIIIDTAASGRRAYAFAVSAAGVLSDAKIDYEGNKDGSWDALFDAATHLGPVSWTAEIRIPFRSLRFDPQQSKWAFHVQSRSRHFQQGLSWAPVSADSSRLLKEAGLITQMDGLSPGRSIELLPSLTTIWMREQGLPAGDCDFSAGVGYLGLCTADLSYGMGVKWAITPALTLDVAMNPDFSQIEADAPQLQVNNRFDIHLKEKRPFFLEGRELFKLPFELVYTRSIGKPDLALKLTGSIGRVRVASLVAHDSEPPDSVADADFSLSENENREGISVLTSVARVQMDLGRTATVGSLALDREYLDGGSSKAHNQVLGVDSQVQLTKQLRAEAAAFFSNAASFEDDDLQGHAAHLRLVVQDDAYRVQSLYQRISEGFRAESGYLPRRNFHHVFNKIDFYYRSDNAWGRTISPGLWASGWIGDDGNTQERRIGANNFWALGGHFWLFAFYERIGESMGSGWLDGNRGKLHFGSKTLDELHVSGGMTAGDVVIRDEALLNGQEPFLGYMWLPEFNMTFRPIPALRLTANYRHRLLFEEQGGREISSEPVLRAALSYHLTRDLSLRYVCEYEEVGNRLVNDGLVRYEPSPGTVFYARYREQSVLEPSPHMELRSLFLKVSILFSL